MNKNLFFFHGEDTYSSSKKVLTWKNQFSQKYGGDFNISEIAGKELTSANFKNETNSLPFAAEKRLIIISDFLAKGKKDNQKKVVEILDDIPDHSIVIFFETTKPDKRLTAYKTLKKKATTEEFKIPEGPLLTKWITNYCQQQKIEITPKAANILAAQIGPNLWQLTNELKKLHLYALNRPITETDIQSLTSQNFSESIFALTDAIATKRAKKSLDTLHTLIASGEDLTRTFYMIARQFRIFLQVKDLQEKRLSQKEIASALKLHPFVVKNSLSQVRNFEFNLLKRTHRNLLSIEIAIKSGKIKLLADDKRDLILAIEKLILNLCR